MKKEHEKKRQREVIIILSRLWKVERAFL